jgi:hypothetical protein
MNPRIRTSLFRSHAIASSYPAMNSAAAGSLYYMAVPTDSQNSSNLTAEKSLRVAQVTDMAELARVLGIISKPRHASVE